MKWLDYFVYKTTIVAPIIITTPANRKLYLFYIQSFEKLV